MKIALLLFALLGSASAQTVECPVCCGCGLTEAETVAATCTDAVKAASICTGNNDVGECLGFGCLSGQTCCSTTAQPAPGTFICCSGTEQCTPCEGGNLDPECTQPGQQFKCGPAPVAPTAAAPTAAAPTDAAVPTDAAAPTDAPADQCDTCCLPNGRAEKEAGTCGNNCCNAGTFCCSTDGSNARGTFTCCREANSCASEDPFAPVTVNKCFDSPTAAVPTAAAPTAAAPTNAAPTNAAPTNAPVQYNWDGLWLWWWLQRMRSRSYSWGSWGRGWY